MREAKKNLLRENEDIPVSAVQLAKIAGLRPQDLHYWAYKGYIKRRNNGTKTPFSISQLDKILLMKTLTKKYGLEAGMSSKLADDILQMYADDPDSYKAAVNLLNMFDKGIKVVAETLVRLGFNELMETEDQNNEPIQTRDEDRKRKDEP